MAATALLSPGIYVNFFLHHYWRDMRYGLMALIQLQGWEMDLQPKLGAWFLQTIMSYVMVTLVNPPRPVSRVSGA